MSWAVIYLAGFGLGEMTPLAPRPDRAEACLAWSRGTATVAAALPLLFAVFPGSMVLPVWLTVFAAGTASGSLEAGARGTRVVAVAARADAVAIPLTWTGPAVLRITGWPTAARGDRWRAPARLLDFRAQPSRAGPRSGQGVMVTGTDTPPEVGAVVSGFLEVSVPPAAGLPGAFDYRRYLAGRDLTWKGTLQAWRKRSTADPVALLGRRVFTPLRQRLVFRLEKHLPPVEAAMARSVLLGIRDEESRRVSEPFADLGLAHLFAVSGLHVGILLGIFLLPAQLGGLSHWWKVGPLAVLLPAYVLLTGMPGSVVRAASLGFLTLTGALLGKRVQPLRIIGLLFWAGTVWNPHQNLDTGLKLSYLAAGGILVVSSLTNGFSFTRHRAADFIFTALAVCVSAQWFTLPLIAGAFGRISLLSPLANLVAVPLFGLAIWGVVLSLLADPLWSAGAGALAAWAWILFRLLGGVAGLVSRTLDGFPLGMPVPGRGVGVFWMALTALVLWFLHRHQTGASTGRTTLLLVVVSLFLGLAAFGPLRHELRAPAQVTAWQFDVGQGDCSMICFPDGWSALIDTGGRYGFSGSHTEGPLRRSVLPFLLRHGLSELDAVILTHGHLDHTGGARALAQRLTVDRWFVSGRAGEALTTVADSGAVFRPTSGSVLHQWQEWTLSVVYPLGGEPADLEENDHSLVVVLRYRQRDLAVWSGDLERTGESRLLAAGQAPRDIQVWKAGHHGSNTSGTAALLARFAPALVIISCGIGNTYGHPNHGPYVVRGDTVALARTDLQGSVKLEWDERGRLTWRSMISGPRRLGLP